MKKFLQLVSLLIFSLLIVSQVQARVSEDELISLLKSKQYKKIELIFDALQNEFDKDITKEDAAWETFRALSRPYAGLEKYLDAWVNSKTNSPYSYLTRARLYVLMGWEYRGGKIAKKTSEKQFSKMEHYFEKALRDIDKAMSINPRLTESYLLLISIYKSLGEDTWPMTKIALSYNPLSLQVRRSYLSSISPRWGGSIEEMETFMKESRLFYEKNPALKNLEGYFAYEKAEQALYFDRNHQQALQYYDEAVKYEKVRKDPDILLRKAIALEKVYSVEKDRSIIQLKVSAYDKAIDFDPNNIEALTRRAKIDHRLGNFERALAAAEKAVKIAPESPYAHRVLGEIYYHQKKLDAAIRELELSIALDHEDMFAKTQIQSTKTLLGLYYNKKDAASACLEFRTKNTFPYIASAQRKDQIASNFKALNIGMKKQEVKALLGDPDCIQPRRGSDPREMVGSVWYFYLDKKEADMLSKIDESRVILTFGKDDKLAVAAPNSIPGLALKGKLERD
jgi:tetratricopeptide (TPR) repeat protein